MMTHAGSQANTSTQAISLMMAKSSDRVSAKSVKVRCRKWSDETSILEPQVKYAK